MAHSRKGFHETPHVFLSTSPLVYLTTLPSNDLIKKRGILVIIIKKNGQKERGKRECHRS
jgi:hypothetical protein